MPPIDPRPGMKHFFQRPRRIAGGQIHAANRVHQQHHSESLLQTVEHRLFDTVIGRQAADENLLDAALAQQRSQGGTMGIERVEARITIVISRRPLRNDNRAGAKLSDGWNSAPGVFCTQCTGQIRRSL